MVHTHSSKHVGLHENFYEGKNIPLDKRYNYTIAKFVNQYKIVL